MALDLSQETWLSKLKYPSGHLKNQVQKRAGFYDSSMRNYFNAIYSYDMIKLLFLPFTEWPAYEMGIINDKGKKIKTPSTKEEKLAWSYFTAQIAYLKSQLNRIITPAKMEKMTGRMAMLRESKENSFDTLITILENETNRNEDIFNCIQETVTSGSMAGGIPQKSHITFRRVL